MKEITKPIFLLSSITNASNKAVVMKIAYGAIMDHYWLTNMEEGKDLVEELRLRAKEYSDEDLPKLIGEFFNVL